MHGKKLFFEKWGLIAVHLSKSGNLNNDIYNVKIIMIVLMSEIIICDYYVCKI